MVEDRNRRMLGKLSSQKTSRAGAVRIALIKPETGETDRAVYQWVRLREPPPSQTVPYLACGYADEWGQTSWSAQTRLLPSKVPAPTDGVAAAPDPHPVPQPGECAPAVHPSSFQFSP